MTQPAPDRPAVVAVLIAVQSLCAAYFLVDVLHDVQAGGHGPFEAFLLAESVATLALIAGIAFEIRVLFRLLERKAHLEHQVSLAARAFHDVVDARFLQWGLTAAERDVAHFTVKGLSISEIAALRQSATGTVKSQLNAIYRKAGVGNRGELLSLLIEDLVATGIEPGTAAPA
ncbi:helix-turn-helix transcriptional regulator [Pararhodobacter marinus]|uniref:helix-turn-helix transcriptional regulator n=1 Tax=Pararhodobacter marinus TaxID=2184063 RepID=UPI0035122DFF